MFHSNHLVFRKEKIDLKWNYETYICDYSPTIKLHETQQMTVFLPQKQVCQHASHETYLVCCCCTCITGIGGLESSDANGAIPETLNSLSSVTGNVLTSLSGVLINLLTVNSLDFFNFVCRKLNSIFPKESKC